MKDILITLTSHPEPTPRETIRSACALARHFDAAISGIICRIEIPNVSNFLADRLVGANEAIAAENRKSRENAEQLIETLSEEAGADRAGAPMIVDFGHFIDPDRLTEHSRLFDLTIVPAYGHQDTQKVAEALIFGSGRPVLLLPASAKDRSFDNIVIAWDGSRVAARAVHDSLPFLRRASDVQLVSVTGDKALSQSAGLDGLAAHLQRHGIKASTNRVPSEGKDAGTVLLNHSEQAGADLLVMGAYGQSRMREFILGGATATILASSRIPVLLAQ